MDSIHLRLASLRISRFHVRRRARCCCRCRRPARCRTVRVGVNSTGARRLWTLYPSVRFALPSACQLPTYTVVYSIFLTPSFLLSRVCDAHACCPSPRPARVPFCTRPFARVFIHMAYTIPHYTRIDRYRNVTFSSTLFSLSLSLPPPLPLPLMPRPHYLM